MDSDATLGTSTPRVPRATKASDSGTGSHVTEGVQAVRLLFWAFGLVVVGLLVVMGLIVAFNAGTGGAIVTGLFALALAGTGFGLWGTALAVKENDELRPPVVETNTEKQNRVG